MALDRIVAHKRTGVRYRMDAAGPQRPLAPSTRSLEEALLRPGPGFVMECKKASPSKGLIRHDYDPAAIARTYSRHACAVSVLADEEFFGGSLDHVRAVSEAVNLPVLCKDFIVDPFQVREARSHGADAVLIMMSVLDDGTAAACLKLARKLAMDALVEVHDRVELERALGHGARIVGINNRDLTTLAVDLGTTEGLARLVPQDVVLMSESGISSHRDVRRLSHVVDGFLVGSSLMAPPDLDVACRELVRGRVKICGLTTPKDALAAAEAGASMGGLVFAEGSPRRVSLETARKTRGTDSLRFVGVFVDSPPEYVARISSELGLEAVQLHGDESEETVTRTRQLVAKECSVWKVRRVSDALPPLRVKGADMVVLDTHRPGARGGTGESFDWSLLAGADLNSVILAGGIDATNAPEAAAMCPYGIDLSTGVERAPGVKSAKKMTELFESLSPPSRRAP